MVCWLFGRLAARLVFLLNVFLFLQRLRERSGSNLATFQLEVGVVDWNCSICVCSSSRISSKSSSRTNKAKQANLDDADVLSELVRLTDRRLTNIEVSWLVGLVTAFPANIVVPNSNNGNTNVARKPTTETTTATTWQLQVV